MGYRNNVSAVDLERPFPGDVDIPRLKDGHVGGFFWRVFMFTCKLRTLTGRQVCVHLLPQRRPGIRGLHHSFQSRPVRSSSRVPGLFSFWLRDTLEQIDVAKGLIDRYDKVGTTSWTPPFTTLTQFQTFKLATNALEVRLAIVEGKIASLLGVEG